MCILGPVCHVRNVHVHIVWHKTTSWRMNHFLMKFFGANGSTGEFPIIEKLADPVKTGQNLADKIAY